MELQLAVVVVFRSVVTKASRACTGVMRKFDQTSEERTDVGLRKFDQTSELIKLPPTISPVGTKGPKST